MKSAPNTNTPDQRPLNAAEQAARLSLLAKEAQDREAYLKLPQRPDEWVIWEAEAVWPKS